MSHEAAQTMRIDLAPQEVPERNSIVRRKRQSKKKGDLADSVKRHERKSGAVPYGLLLESIYDGVLITDRKGYIIDFNDRVRALFNADSGELTGVPVWELFSGADTTLVETIQGNLRSHKYALLEGLCLRYDDSAFPGEIAVNRLDLDAAGHQLCFFIRDISVRRKAQAALEDAVERLQAHDRSRMEFVSNVSHELRTPLTSMMYAVNNMLRGVVGPLPEKAVRYLERFDADCKRLLVTVNDILDLRQLESETLTLSKSRISCTALIHAGVETLRVQADAKEMKIAVELPPYDLFVNCDVQKMERVMINIIGNAVKFTPAKGGCITVRLERHLELENMALLSVSDNGVGIPAEALQRVTQRYFRVGGHVVGSGLGLAISREIVDLHGGTLSMASPVPGSDKGTMVAVSLPLCDPPIVAIFGETMDMAYEARRQVGNYGYRTLMTYSIEEALTLCAAHKADMLLFECDTGINNDFSPLLRLRNDSRTQQMPVLVLSRSEISRPCRDMLQHLGVPLLPVPWLERDLVERLNGAFSGRSLVSPV